MKHAQSCKQMQNIDFLMTLLAGNRIGERSVIIEVEIKIISEVG